MITDNRHEIQYRGATYASRSEGGGVVYRYTYGLVSVLADKAPNFCYREFWF